MLDDDRVLIVFESMNAVSNALAFHGIAFVDLTTKLMVWRAKDPPPAGAPQQLAIASSDKMNNARNEPHSKTEEGHASSRHPNASSSTSSASPLLGEDDRKEWWKKRQKSRTTIQQLAQAAVKADEMNEAGKEARMKELCYRQGKALVIILQDAVEKAKAELEEKQLFVKAATTLLLAKEKNKK